MNKIHETDGRNTVIGGVIFKNGKNGFGESDLRHGSRIGRLAKFASEIKKWSGAKVIGEVLKVSSFTSAEDVYAAAHHRGLNIERVKGGFVIKGGKHVRSACTCGRRMKGKIGVRRDK